MRCIGGCPLLLYLYYRQHHDFSPLLLLSPKPADDTKGCTNAEGHPRRLPLSSFLQASEVAISLTFFSLLALAFVLPGCPPPISTPPLELPSLASPPLHCTSQSTSLPLAVDPDRKLTGRVYRCSIFGILSVQCYTYYHRYPLDRTFYRVLVRIRSPARGSFLTPAPLPFH